MKKTVLLLIGICVAAFAFAQEKKQIKIANENGKYQLTVEKTVDGKTTKTTKTFDSREEMMKDPELEGSNMYFFDGNDRTKVIKSSSKDGTFDITVDVDSDTDEEVTTSVFVESAGDGHLHENHEVIVYKGDGSGNQSSINGFDFKTEDGEVKIYRDGEEITGDSWTSDDGVDYKIKRQDDGKVIITGGEGEVEWFGTNTFDVKEEGNYKVIRLKTQDGSDVQWTDDEGEHIKIEEIIREHGDGDHKVMVFKSHDGTVQKLDGENINVFVKAIDGDEEEIKVTVNVVEALKIHIEEIEGNEFEELLEGSKNLKVDDINYYPNPNEGRFNLQFSAPKKPTSVQVLSLDGRTVYNEELTEFTGIYNNEIDLSAQKRGIYLLRIQQGSKSMNRKIVLE